MKDEKKEAQKPEAKEDQEIEKQEEQEAKPDLSAAAEIAKEVKEDKIAPRKVRVVIKSLPYNGRYGSQYRAHSIQEIDEEEAERLVEAGIADYYSAVSKSNFGKIETQSLDVTKLAEGVRSAQLGKQ